MPGARRGAVCVCCFILMSVYYVVLFGPRVGVCLSVSVSLSVCPVVSVLHFDACRGVSREHGLPGPLILVDEDKFLAELLDVIFDLLELRFKFLLAFLFGRRV